MDGITETKKRYNRKMIDSLRLQNFRSYSDYTTEFAPGVNIIVGPNASGKTNLLEAVYVINRGKSFRVTDRDLIKHGESWSRIDATSESSKRTWKLENGTERPDKTIEIDGTLSKRITNKNSQPTTLFEPNHLRLLNGSPETRRTHLDQILSQTSQQFKTNLSKYNRALRQRNALLKQSGVKKDDLFVWDVKLSEYGGYVNESRKELVEHINSKVSKNYSKIAKKKTKVHIEYSSSVADGDYKSSLLKKLQTSAQEDSFKGFTSIGPHREDFSVFFDGKDGSVAASRGESRTLVLVLKLIELKLLETELEEKPILLLDDVFSELDGGRRRALTEHISGYQTLITTTDAEAVIEHFSDGNYKIIPTSQSQ